MKWGLELLLGILCLVAFLCIGKQLLKEPFADTPTPEVYDIQLFFQRIPFAQICDLWIKVLPKIQQSFQVNEKGMSLPQDVVQQKVKQYIQSQIPTGPLACPVAFPSSSDLDTVHAYVMKLQDTFLEQAHRTLIFSAIQIQKELVNSKKALSKKKTAEGFLTECTFQELLVKQNVPLQCIDSAVMKATEQESIRNDPDHARKQKLKKEIALKLNTLQTTYLNYVSATTQGWKFTADSASKDFLETSLEIEKLKKKENEEDADKLRELGEKKAALSDTIQTAGLYLDFLSLSYPQILEKTNKNLAESAQLQADIQSGKISFTS